MATLTVLEKWTAKFPAFPGGTYMKDGVKQTMEPRPARTAEIALVSAADGTQNQIELPEGYEVPISVGDVLQLTCVDWPEAPFRTRNITRHQPAAKKS